MSSYGLRFIDSVEIYEKIAVNAYYKWLRGSSDMERNWIEAEREELGGEDEDYSEESSDC